MKSARRSRGTLPVEHFQTKPAAALRTLHASRGPLVLTHRGKAAAIVLTLRNYARLRERERFLAAVAEGLADDQAGRTIDDRELEKRLDVVLRNCS